MNTRRGSRNNNDNLRVTPKRASGLSDYRKAVIEKDIERGSVKEAGSYEGSRLNRPPQNIVNASPDSDSLKRSAWLPGIVGSREERMSDNKLTAVGAIAHSSSFANKELTGMKKVATDVGSVGGSGFSSGVGSYDRLAPEVYSPLFTMANLNLPRDRITINAWCFLPNTMVNMADGTKKPIAEIENGDIVLSADGNPRKVISKFQRTVNEEIVGIKAKGIQNYIWATKNHGFKAVKNASCRGSKIHRCKTSPCKRCGKEVNYNFNKISAGELSKYDLLYNPISKENTDFFTKEEMVLLGYYAAEGYVSNNEFGFVLNINEDKTANIISQIIKNIFDYEIKINKCPELGVLKLRGYNKEICSYLSKHCNGKATTKTLSRELVSSNSNLLIYFLKAWADGDGCRTKQGTRFDGRTSSKNLADQLSFCFLKCGFSTSPYKQNVKDMISPVNGKTYQTSPSYLIRFAGNDARKFFKGFENRFKVINSNSKNVQGSKFILEDKCISWIEDIKEKKYNGKVYNIEVEEDHTYVVEDVAVFNCRNFFMLHPVVRNAITLHATYPISKLNLKCQDKNVLQFFEDMVEEMDLLGALGDISLEYWKLGEKIQGSSLITMADGSLKPVSEIENGDTVLTHLGNKKKVINKFRKPTDKVIEDHLKIYKIHALGVADPLIISGRHPILHMDAEFFDCSTLSCKKKKMRTLTNREKCSNCRKENNKTDFEPNFVETNNIKERDILFGPFNKDVEVNNEFDDQLCYVMGYWLAEGCYCKNTTKKSGLKFTTYDKDYLNSQLIPLLEERFDHAGKTYISKSSNFSVEKNKYDHLLNSNKRNGPVWADFFYKHCGEYSKTKTLSEEIMSLSTNLQMQILAGFIDGDGCVDKQNGHIIICTSSNNLANQFVLILRRIGLHPTISRISRKNEADKFRVKIVAEEAYNFKPLLKTDKKNNLKHPQWSATHSSLYKNWQLLTITKIENITEQFNEEFMYDIEVEDDHSYVANGIAIHNCFPFAELNEKTGKWSKIIIQNPDYVKVKKSVLSGDSIITLKPDATLQRLVFSNNPADSQLRKQIPERILYHIRTGQSIPLDNFNISHLKMLSSPYDVRGTSIIVSVFKDLMLYDKLRECYSEDTEFLTEDGFKKYDEIGNDKLATFNSEKGELEYQDFSNRTKYHYDGDMYHFNGKKIDVLVTPNHRMWLSQAKSHGGYKDYDFILAENVKSGYFYKAQSTANWAGEEIDEVKIGDYKISAEKYMKIVGHLISEGCIQHKPEKYQYSVSANQSFKKKDSFDKIKSSMFDLAESCNVYCSTNYLENNTGFSKNSRMEEWRITRKFVSEHFANEIGTKSHTKYIPKWIKNLSPRLLNILLEALVDGDAHIHIGEKSVNYRYSTISKQLADDVQEIAFKCGHAPIKFISYNGQGKKYYAVGWSSSNYGKNPFIYGNKKENNKGGGAIIDKVPYSGNVVCFTVPNSLLVVRRNGIISIQGNSKFAQADGMINPVTLIKVGGLEGEYKATQQDLEFYKNMFEEAQYDKDSKIVTHSGVAVERVGFAGSVLDIAADLEFITKNIYTGLMIPPAIVDTESAAYSSASIGLEVLRQRYFNFRNIIAKWLVNKIFAPISEVQNFYEYKNKEKHLIVPEIEWNQMNLYDLQDYISNITGMVSAGQASVQTLYRSLGLNYQDEQIKMRQESIDKAIRMREETALSSMSLTELRSLDPEKPIVEPIDSKEREKSAPPEAGMGGPGDMGLPGDMGGGVPGGLPELSPPPGGEMGGDLPGAGAPEGGVTPPMGPGTGMI